MVTRDALMAHLKAQGILAVFHYIPLHTSPMGLKLGYRPGSLPVTEDVSSRLLRLPLYYDLSESDQTRVVDCVSDFLRRSKLSRAVPVPELLTACSAR